jgi:hypothetical protein
MFGSDTWETELYPIEDGTDLFGDAVERRRELNPAGLEKYVKKRLETIFARVLDPLALPVDTRPQRFSLFLCISNPTSKAIGLASSIGEHLLNPKRHLIIGPPP